MPVMSTSSKYGTYILLLQDNIYSIFGGRKFYTRKTNKRYARNYSTISLYRSYTSSG